MSGLEGCSLKGAIELVFLLATRHLFLSHLSFGHLSKGGRWELGEGVSEGAIYTRERVR